MNTALRLTILVIGLLFVIYHFYLLIKKHVTERTAIIWIIGCLWVLVVAMFPSLLNRVAQLVGVDYPPSLLYLVAILILLTLVLYQSIQVSALEGKLREIGRRVALMEFKSMHELSSSSVQTSPKGEEDEITDEVTDEFESVCSTNKDHSE